MRKLLILILGFFLISSVYALGCCMDPSMGVCSPNVEADSCNSENSQFYSDQTCDSISECNFGCCQFGTTSRYVLQSSCYFLSRSAGMEFSWQESTQEQCAQSANSQDTGACVMNTRYDTQCLYTTRASCGTQGTFYTDLLCSSPSLNTTCRKTDKTFCFKEDVYYKDSCGNPDERKTDCDYDAGTTCMQESLTSAICKSSNCNLADVPHTPLSRFLWKPIAMGGGNLVILLSGSLGATVYGPDGEVIETGVSDGPSNGYDDTIRFSRAGREFPAGSFVLSGTSRCYISNPSARLQSCVPLPDNIDIFLKNGASWCAGGGRSVGSRFFKQYCLNGEIYTEPCSDYRNEICEQEGNVASCIINPWQDCLAVMPDPDNLEDDSWKEDCDPEFCYIWEPEVDNCIQGTVYSTLITYCPSEEEGSWTTGTANPWAPITIENPETFFESATDVLEIPNPLLGDLQLDMCLPKIPGGSSDNDEEGSCSLGNYEKAVWFDHDKGKHEQWSITENEKANSVVDTSAEPSRWGNAGIIQFIDGSWHDTDPRVKFCNIRSPKNVLYNASKNGEYICEHDDHFVEVRRLFQKLINDEKIPDPKVIEFLDERSLGLGDCAGNINWVGSGSSKDNLIVSSIKRGESARYDVLLFSLKYEVNPWRSPSSGDCSLCGADSLPCSEYRCQALGRSCEYKEPQGVDKGYCVSSNDNSPPIISGSTNPQSPIAPFSAVEIIVSTNEDSHCAFNIGSAGSALESMENDFDDGWNREHKIILNVPGQVPDEFEDVTAYPLLITDGKYDLYVRCEDVAGNSNANAYKLSFEVMQTPDNVPPAILNFTPVSGSAIIFNTTEKEIEFKLNEPAECRWDFEDKTYEEMGTMVSITGEDETYESNTNQFSCDSEVSDLAVLNGYFCSGTLRNVTLNLTKTTDYYIKCKDQPWLEGNEDEIYQRNTNQNPTKYTLRPSNLLEISEIGPIGELVLSVGSTNITLTAKTRGGGYANKASCKWRLFYKNETTILYPFANTNSATHTQIITNKSEGDYKIEVVCTDEAGNRANRTENLKLRYETTVPVIARIYNDRGSLKIITNEQATCKFINAADSGMGCSFSFTGNESVSMNSNGLIHTTSLKKGSTYFIKCKDFFDNQNSACAIIGKVI